MEKKTEVLGLSVNLGTLIEAVDYIAADNNHQYFHIRKIKRLPPLLESYQNPQQNPPSLTDPVAIPSPSSHPQIVQTKSSELDQLDLVVDSNPEGIKKLTGLLKLLNNKV